MNGPASCFGAWSGDVVAAASDTPRWRHDRSVGRGGNDRAAERPCVRVVDPGEYQPSLVRLERGDQRLLVVVHASLQACASAVSIVSMIEMISSNSISGLSTSWAAGRMVAAPPL